MMNMMDQLQMMTSADWCNAFAMMEAQAAAEARTMNGPYYFYGEIDCPGEMLRYPNVTLEMVQRVGKTNWLRDTAGNFRTCGDALIDELADAGKLLHGYPEFGPTEYDQLKTVESRVKYRMEHQHVDERLAKELVSEDEGFNAFKYRYVMHIKYTTEDQDHNLHIYEMDEDIDADSPEEAHEIAKNCNGWYVGLDIRCGFAIVDGKRIETHEIIVLLESDIKETIELC